MFMFRRNIDSVTREGRDQNLKNRKSTYHSLTRNVIRVKRIVNEN